MNELYKSKLVTAKEAAKVVKSGNWVDYGWTVTTPVDFDKEPAKRLPELHDVNFRGCGNRRFSKLKIRLHT